MVRTKQCQACPKVPLLFLLLYFDVYRDLLLHRRTCGKMEYTGFILWINEKLCLWPGAIIGNGDRKTWDPRGPMIWNILSIFLEQIASSWRHILALLYALVVSSRVYVVTLHDQIKNSEICEILCGFFTGMAGNKAVKTKQGSSMQFYALS